LCALLHNVDVGSLRPATPDVSDVDRTPVTGRLRRAPRA